MATHLTLRRQESPREALATAIESFYQRCHARNLTPGTIQFYAYRFLSFRRFLDEKELNPIPADITPQVVREFLSWEQQRSSAVTAKHSYRTLTAFFSFLIKDGQLNSSPMEQVESIRQKSPVIPTFSMMLIKTLLASCDNSFVGVRDRALIMVLLDTGCALRNSARCAWVMSIGENYLSACWGRAEKDARFPLGKPRGNLCFLTFRGVARLPALTHSSLGYSVNHSKPVECMKC